MMKKKHVLLIGIGAALAAAASYFLLRRRNAGTEKPPKNAPQVKVNNPGDQSEFPKAASDSELG